jgi:type I restriction enzyme S subunit
VSWSTIELGNHVEKVLTWNPTNKNDQSLFSYIDLSSIDKDRKEIDKNNIAEIISSEAPSRARQLVAAGDVLIATVRPNLNGVAIVPTCLDGATASTGYCVLRADEKGLHGKYLYYWAQTNIFISDMMSKATGATYPAVSDKIIKESKIPCPTLEEQKRIANILYKTDVIRRKRQQAINLADEFLRAVFLDMFGNLVTNPKGWEVKPIMEVAPFSPLRNVSITDDEKVWLLNLDQVESNSGQVISKYICEYAQVGDSTSWFDQSHVLYCKLRPYLNKVVMPDSTGLATSELIPLRPNPVHLNREYLTMYLRSESFVTWATNKVAGAKMPRLSTSELREHVITLPPMNLQNKFASIYHKIVEIKKKYEIATLACDDGFASLSQKAFSGDL